MVLSQQLKGQSPGICRGEAVAVCSIEKANVTVNRLAQEKRFGRASFPSLSAFPGCEMSKGVETRMGLGGP